MLVDVLKLALANNFVFYLKTQYFHWNIEGPNFVQYHEFLGNLYKDVHESIDAIAELIRTQDAYAPGTLSRLKELSTIEESDVLLDDKSMLSTLLEDNKTVIASLTAAYLVAEENKQLGVSNYLQDRIQAHEKHDWMLRSLLK